MSAPLFRDQAVKAYMDPDARGGLVRATPPSLARLFAVLTLLFVGAVVASIVVRVKVTARVRGIVRPSEGIFVVRAPATGYVRAVEVTVGQEVLAGTVLARLDAPVLAPVAGFVDAITVHLDELATAGAPIVKIVPAGDRLAGFLAVPSRYRAHLRVGHEVRVSFDEYPSTEMGFGRGRIRRVSDDVLTPELAAQYLPESEARGPASYLVEVDLLAMPPRARGEFHNGMAFDGVVAVREQRIITLLIEPLQRFFGE